MGRKFTEGDNFIEGINPRSVLEGMSNNNLKHSIKHLSEFQQLDPNLTEDLLRNIGAEIVQLENLISNLNSSKKVFEIANIGAVPVKLKA